MREDATDSLARVLPIVSYLVVHDKVIDFIAVRILRFAFGCELVFTTWKSKRSHCFDTANSLLQKAFLESGHFVEHERERIRVGTSVLVIRCVRHISPLSTP